MIARLVRIGVRLRNALWGRPIDVDLFLRYHPHLEEADARRVLIHVIGETGQGCPSTVAAVSAAIRSQFPNWFFDYDDAARHAGEALGYDLVDHPVGGF